jgi:hypothetical protein
MKGYHVSALKNPGMQNTYLVQDRSQEKELMRVHLQDQLLTAGMGGVLVEQADPTMFRQVLDVRLL